LIWLVVRADLRRRLVFTLALAVLVGIVGAATMVAFAGSRRVASSFDRLEQATLAQNIDMEFDTPQQPSVLGRIAEVPGVEGASFRALVAVAPAGADLVPFENTISFATLVSVGAVHPDGRVVDGRPLGNNPDEVLLNRAMAEQLGVGVGDHIPLASLSPATSRRVIEQEEVQKADGPRTTATVVGITTDVEDVADVPEGHLIVPAAYAQTYDVGSFAIAAGVRADADRIGPTTERLRRMFPDAIVTPTGDFGARINEGLQVQSFGLLAFALAVGLTGGIAIAHQVARSTSAWSAEHRVLGALGATAADRRVASVVRAVPVALGGMLIAIAAGVVAGPVAITGIARQTEPDSGVWFDWPVVGAIALLLAVLVLGVAFASTPTSAPARPERGLVERGLLSHLPVMTFMGARRSLGSDTRRWSGREALGTLVAALLIVVALLTFTGSIDGLFTSPAKWGANFDAYVMPGDSKGTFAKASTALAADDEIKSASAVSEGEITMARPDGSESVVRVNWAEPVKGAVDPWVLVKGDRLRGDGDVLAGAGVLQDMHLGIGDQLDVPAGTKTTSLRITGRIVSYGEDQIDDGIALTPSTAARVLGNSDINSKVLVVDFADGVDQGAAITRLRERYGDAGRVPAPGTIDNLDELGLLPLVLGIVVSILGVYAVALSFALSVTRDEHFFATMRAIGATRTQRRRVVVTQALFIVLTSLVVALPAGILVGRAVYRTVATSLGAIATPTVPTLALVELVIVTCAGITLISLLPARRAAVIGSEALRNE
jgi:ABC-type lipoprotein release transport system permease subunit